MREEIQKTLIGIELLRKKFLKQSRVVVSALAVVAALLVFSYLYFPLEQSPRDIITIFFIGCMVCIVLVVKIYSVVIPKNYLAFQKIAQAIEILEKSNVDIAYEEAYRCIKKAHETLKKIELYPDIWHTQVNEASERFLENIELIVLPATSTSSIKIEHLEEIALATISEGSLKIEEVNKSLESNYEKHKPQPKKIEIISRTLHESSAMKALFSLTLGYGLILMICLIFVAFTQQDFKVFATENPEIIILGGFGFSGITFWKTK